MNNSITESILFNYYSFGSLLTVSITLLLTLRLFSLKGVTNGTTHLAIGFIFLTLFQSGYFIGAIIYHPIGAYHRWLTAGAILPAITHIGQFLLRYPTNNYPKFSRVILWVQWIISSIVILIFTTHTLTVDTVYQFTAHTWDFHAEKASRYVGIIIAVYTLFNFLLFPLWKIIFIKEKKLALTLFMFALLIAGVVPNIFNVLSRDGVIDRSTYLTSIAFLFVLSFFVITIVFFNNSIERTTFMVKLISITLVTLLLMMQILVFFSLQDKEFEYDFIKKANLEKAVETNKLTSDVEYYYKYNLDSTEPITPILTSKNKKINYELLTVDFKNTYYFEKINSLNNENFKFELMEILTNTDEYFTGYKNSIIHFINSNKTLSNNQLKEKTINYISQLNQSTFIAANKLSVMSPQEFCKSSQSYLESNSDIISFKDVIFSHMKNCEWDEVKVKPEILIKKTLLYFRFFKPTLTRYYRISTTGNNHFISYIYFDKERNELNEIGFSYLAYRQFIHPTALRQVVILIFVLLIVLIFYPLFFRVSLITPLTNLLNGLEKVNNGNLDVVVPVKVKDEIGFLAESFNSMVSSIKNARIELRNYAETLEEKVKERTAEVQEKMEEVQQLKVQQDGDYFLTSLLAQPLFYNANKSTDVSTEFIIKQKKEFEFRGKHAELGGDICVTGNLRLGTTENHSRYIMAMNGDAMGKSMQGAGGALVMGVVINSIMARSAANNKILNLTPEEWLTNTYEEINAVFKSFNGSMVISAVVLLIEENSGMMWYFNAEHPFTILYRNKKAEFIETGLNLRKLGLDSEFEFEIKKFQLQKGDTIIIGSDGRDDINLEPTSTVRIVNEDEKLILSLIEKSNANLNNLLKEIEKIGELTDDLSIIKIGFYESSEPQEIFSDSNNNNFLSREATDINEVYENAKQLYKENNVAKSIELLKEIYDNTEDYPKINKLLALLSFKTKDYQTAVDVLDKYLKDDTSHYDYWLYLSISNKKIGKIDEAILAAKKVLEINEHYVPNLVNLADLYRLKNQFDLAKDYIQKALELDQENKDAQKLLTLISQNI